MINPGREVILGSAPCETHLDAPLRVQPLECTRQANTGQGQIDGKRLGMFIRDDLQQFRGKGLGLLFQDAVEQPADVSLRQISLGPLDLEMVGQVMTRKPGLDQILTDTVTTQGVETEILLVLGQKIFIL